MQPQGLYYIGDAIDSNDLVEWLDSNNNWTPIHQGSNARVVQHYGYRYDYQTRNIYEKCEPIPQIFEPLKNMLTQYCIDANLITDAGYFNQCIVNNYEPGQGINPHIDVRDYGGVIGCFTIGGGATMIFRRFGTSYELYSEPNSLYVMSGDARYKWTHEMEGKKYDIVNALRVRRMRRISITFRSVE